MKYRTFQLQIEKRSDDSSFYPAVLSSETPVDRDFGTEVLSHGAGEVDMSRAKRGLPLLWNHDSREVVGRVEWIRLTTDRKLRGELRPGTSERAKEIWNDVRAGIVQDISIGYSYNNSKPVRQDNDTLLFKNWQPLEVSLVAVPADVQAGIGRSKTLPLRRTTKMEIDDDDDVIPKRSYTELERRRVQAIRNLGRANGVSRELIDKMCDDGLSPDECSTIILKELQARSYGKQYDARELGMTQREVGRYSIGRAITALATNDWSKAGLEREASMAFSQRTGRQPQGFFVPSDVLIHRTVSKGAGVATIGTETLGGSFIDLLRNKTAVI